MDPYATHSIPNTQPSFLTPVSPDSSHSNEHLGTKRVKERGCRHGSISFDGPLSPAALLAGFTEFALRSPSYGQKGGYLALS